MSSDLRWYQYRLRTLLLLPLVVAVACPCAGPLYRWAVARWWPQKYSHFEYPNIHTGHHPATIYLDADLQVVGAYSCPLCSLVFPTELQFRIQGTDDLVPEEGLPSATVKEGKQQLLKFQNEPKFRKEEAEWRTYRADYIQAQTSPEPEKSRQ